MDDPRDYITAFERKRSMPMIYAFSDTKQLIFKNFQGDGVTIVGTKESIERFLDCCDFDTNLSFVGAGFYPWRK